MGGGGGEGGQLPEFWEGKGASRCWCYSRRALLREESPEDRGPLPPRTSLPTAEESQHNTFLPRGPGMTCQHSDPLLTSCSSAFCPWEGSSSPANVGGMLLLMLNVTVILQRRDKPQEGLFSLGI